MGSQAWSDRLGDIGGIWQIHLTESPLKSESHSEAPFNLFQAPLTTCPGSLLWSTPLQNSLISVKISRAGECLSSLSECKSSTLDRTVSWLSNVYSGNPLKGGIFILRQIPIDWFSFFCSSDSACNSYQRSHLPRHIGHAGFVQQRIRWWPGWWFIQCSPPVGGVVRVCRGSGKHFGKIFFLYIINTLRLR